MYVSFDPADNQNYFVLPIPFNCFVELNGSLICKKAGGCCTLLFHKCAVMLSQKDEVKNESTKIGV